MKAHRGCRPGDDGTLQRQVMPMDLDVYWCDVSVRERWKQDVPSTITRSIRGLDSQNRSRTKDLVISIINNQHPLKRRTTKGGTVTDFPITVERMTQTIGIPIVRPINLEESRCFVGTVRAVRRFLERKAPKPAATQSIYPRRSDDSGVTKASECRPLATRFFDVLTTPLYPEKNR